MRPEWQLRDNPFAFVGRSLSPRDDAKQLALYLDFYDWSQADLFNGLDANGSIKFIAPQNNATTTILISGESGSGRSSIKNLLVYELEKSKNPAPIVLVLTVPASPTLEKLATALSFKLSQEMTKRSPADAPAIQQTIANWRAVSGADPNAELLFPELRQNLDEALPGADVIVTLDASSHNLTRDSARATNAMLNGFATFVIMSLTAPGDAQFIRNKSLEGGKPSWIGVPGVDAATIVGYVSRRLAAERTPGAQPASATFPFDGGAIEELFAKTSGKGNEKISIRIALTRLTMALQNKINNNASAPTISRGDMRKLLA